MHPLRDLVLQSYELVLVDERLEQPHQTRLGLFALQQLLLAVGPYDQGGRDHVHHVFGVGDRLQRRLGLLGQLRVLRHVGGELPRDRVHERPQARLDHGSPARPARCIGR